MARNREKTSGRILEAAARLLQDKGFSGWGINSIARAATVDKVLIYRYYGSLAGLLEELVQATRFWPDPDEVDAGSGEAFVAGTIQSIEQSPLWKVLTSMPERDPCTVLVQQKSAGELGTWLAGIRKRCSGHITDAKLQCLPALIQFSLLNRRATLSAGEIWGCVSPPLQWIGKDDFQAFEELPTELL